MKNKSWYALAPAACLLFWGCPERERNIPPQPDTEVETATDAVWATYAITDIHLITAFMAENDNQDHFYTTQFTRHPESRYLTWTFHQTLCRDGRKRDGTIFAEWANPFVGEPDRNADYYHNYRFRAAVKLINYKVDGWLIEDYDPMGQGKVELLVEASDYDPAVTNLRWRLTGKYKFTHPADPSRNMVWDGVIEKTLVNTSDPRVFSRNRAVKIHWPSAQVSYSGKVTGLTHGNVPFTMEISDKTPLVRDLTCTPDPVVSVELDPPTVRTSRSEHHPFVKGIVSFTTGSAYPRQIYLGNEEDPSLPWQCDNTGVVMIKGISYKVNLRE